MKSKITRCERREEASVTTFALAVTRVFIYSVNCGQRWRRRRGICRRRHRVWRRGVCNRRTHGRAYTCAYAFTRRAANDLCIPLITSVHCTVLSGDHSFIRPTCALRYCQRQKHPDTNNPRCTQMHPAFVTLRARPLSGETVLRSVPRDLKSVKSCFLFINFKHLFSPFLQRKFMCH